MPKTLADCANPKTAAELLALPEIQLCDSVIITTAAEAQKYKYPIGTTVHFPIIMPAAATRLEEDTVFLAQDEHGQSWMLSGNCKRRVWL